VGKQEIDTRLNRLALIIGAVPDCLEMIIIGRGMKRFNSSSLQIIDRNFRDFFGGRVQVNSHRAVEGIGKDFHRNNIRLLIDRLWYYFLLDWPIPKK